MTYTAATPLDGPAQATREQALAFLTRRGLDDATARVIVQFYWQHAALAALDPIVLVAQAVHETTDVATGKPFGSWWSQPPRRNPAGIGVTGESRPHIADGAPDWQPKDDGRDYRGYAFDMWYSATLAHVVHLAAYRYAPGNEPQAIRAYFATLYDPRLDAVLQAGFRGIARTLGDLNGRWAVPGATYGPSIARVANEIASTAPYTEPTGGDMEIIDVRDQLPTNPGGGSGERYAAKDGIIIHYSGPAVDRGANTLAVLRSYAEYHIGPYLGEAGIAYHYDVGNDARVRLVRDPDAVLWHCASWPENRTYYAVHVMIGDNQHASAAQLEALCALVDELRQRHGMARGSVKGHQEVSATSCPGTLMADYVLPYRAGKETAVADGWRFPETGKYLGGGFYAYWRDRGGLAVFGLPLTEEMDEGGRTVQYFERSRFEYHPDNPEPYRVMLTRLGALAAKSAGLSGPGID